MGGAAPPQLQQHQQRQQQQQQQHQDCGRALNINTNNNNHTNTTTTQKQHQHSHNHNHSHNNNSHHNNNYNDNGNDNYKFSFNYITALTSTTTTTATTMTTTTTATSVNDRRQRADTAPQQETDAASILCGKWDAVPRNQISENGARHHTARHMQPASCVNNKTWGPKKEETKTKKKDRNKTPPDTNKTLDRAEDLLRTVSMQSAGPTQGREKAFPRVPKKTYGDIRRPEIPSPFPKKPTARKILENLRTSNKPLERDLRAENKEQTVGKRIQNLRARSKLFEKDFEKI